MHFDDPAGIANGWQGFNDLGVHDLAAHKCRNIILKKGGFVTIF